MQRVNQFKIVLVWRPIMTIVWLLFLMNGVQWCDIRNIGSAQLLKNRFSEASVEIVNVHKLSIPTERTGPYVRSQWGATIENRNWWLSAYLGLNYFRSTDADFWSPSRVESIRSSTTIGFIDRPQSILWQMNLELILHFNKSCVFMFVLFFKNAALIVILFRVLIVMPIEIGKNIIVSAAWRLSYT